MFGNSRYSSLLFPARLPPYARNFVILIFCIDFLFIFIHLGFHGAYYFGHVPDLEAFSNFNITEDRSFPEWFNYLKLFLISSVLFIISFRIRNPLFVVLAFCFFYALLDDSLRLHERGGGLLVERLGLPALAGMRSQDLGEFLIHAAAGFVAIAGLAVGWLRADAAYRRYAATFVFLLFLLAFFAVIVDVFRRAVISDADHLARGLAAVIEDGGEMLVTALSCWVALGAFFHIRRPPDETAAKRGDGASRDRRPG